MKFIPKLKAASADQKHVNNRSRLVSAPGANYYNGCPTSNVWRRNMSRSRESQAVCALRSLSIMGGIQNLIICVKMAWSERLDCGVNIR